VFTSIYQDIDMDSLEIDPTPKTTSQTGFNLSDVDGLEESTKFGGLASKVAPHSVASRLEAVHLAFSPVGGTSFLAPGDAIQETDMEEMATCGTETTSGPRLGQDLVVDTRSNILDSMEAALCNAPDCDRSFLSSSSSLPEPRIETLDPVLAPRASCSIADTSTSVVAMATIVASAAMPTVV
jgi:hypothetical protein